MLPTKRTEPRKNYTQRLLMRRRRLWARVCKRYEPLADEEGYVSVMPVANFKWGGSHFLPSEVSKLHWRLAALLAEATLVDVPGLRRGRRAKSGKPKSRKRKE